MGEWRFNLGGHGFPDHSPVASILEELGIKGVLREKALFMPISVHSFKPEVTCDKG